MRNALIVCVGSRGDAEPFAALTQALLASPGWGRVIPFFQEDLTYLCPKSAAADLQVMPFKQADFYKFVANPSKAAEVTTPRERFISVCCDMIAGLVLPCGQSVLAEAEKSKVDVVICSILARSIALPIAEKLGIRACCVHLQPTVPTRRFPHHSETEACAKALVAAFSNDAGKSDIVADDPSPENVEKLYWHLEELQWSFLQPHVDSFRNDIGLDKQSFETLKPVLSGHSPDVLIANCFSLEIVPSALASSGPCVRDIGPLADNYIPTGFEPDEKLVKFLADGSPPVCVGYGSMPLFGQQASMTRKVLMALRDTGTERAVIVGGAAGLGVEHLSDSIEDGDLFEWSKERVFEVPACPYPWLLPRCQSILCHGGAGVVAAALRAGVPAVVSPHISDQFLWGRVVDMRGIGALAGPNLSDVSTESLLNGIRKVQAPEVRSRCSEIRDSISSVPDGVQNLVAFLESKGE